MNVQPRMLQSGALGVLLALIALTSSGCGGGSESPSNNADRAVTANRADAAGLAPLYSRLRNRGLSVQVIRRADLPATKPRASRARAVRPSIGLRTDLQGNAYAVVYRFGSAKLAQAAAPSLLSHWGDGVQGCGRTVYFTRRQRHAHHDYGVWLAQVQSSLRAGGCRTSFVVTG